MSDNKKIISRLLWAAMVLGLVACETNDEKSSNDFISTADVEKAKKMDPVYYLTDDELEKINEKKLEYQEGTRKILSDTKKSTVDTVKSNEVHSK